MAKSPHTAEFKAKVSQEYLDGLGSFPFLANKYSVGSQTIIRYFFNVYGNKTDNMI